jgi:hydroxyacylglutathione hydrolase
LNLHGAAPLGHSFWPDPLSPEEIADAQDRGMTLLDLRDAEAFAGAHSPGSIAIPLGLLPSHAGWHLSYDKPIVLVGGNVDEIDRAVRYLARIGFDRIEGHLANGMDAWETSGREVRRISAISVQEIAGRLNDGADFTLLDVRRPGEYGEIHIPGSTNLYVGELMSHLYEIPKPRPVTTFCSSGQRATIAASLLEAAGIDEVEVCFGSMEACKAVGCPIEPAGRSAN